MGLWAASSSSLAGITSRQGRYGPAFRLTAPLNSEVRLSGAGVDWANGQLDAEIDTRVSWFHSLFAP